MDVCVKFADFRLNSGRIVRLFAGRTRFTHIRAIFRPKAASDIISGTFVRSIAPISV